MNQFDLATDPIEGMNVLEASAGTGKTFTIAGLYLRLVLEKKLDVNRILVVTFTEAATAELDQRVRDTLKAALNAFTRKIDGTDDPQSDNYPSPIPRLLETMDAREAVSRLTVNLQTFDEAAIRTIHGFCRMLLLENSFECGAQFDCELEANQDALIERVTGDYWRRTIGHASPLLIRALNASGGRLTVKSLSRLIGQAMDHLDVEIIPPAPGLPDETVLQTYTDLIRTVQSLWSVEGEAIMQLLAGNEALKQTTYAPNRMRARSEALELFLRLPAGTALLPDDCLVFTQARITASAKKGRRAPEHEFFALMDKTAAASRNVEQAYAAAVLTVKRNAFEYAELHLERRKRELNILAFNDLLLKTRDALRSPGAAMLISKMRSRFSAVLIDEFQDTDPVQYEIFSRLFADGRTILFYIGDPKQAIYGFRGADVFAYMTAIRQQGVKRSTLAMNYRSSQGLIAAVNTIFRRAVNPFVIRQIEFSPVIYPEHKPQQRLVIDGREAAPMVLMYRSPGSVDARPLNKDASTSLVVTVTADEIARLLTLGAEGKAYIEHDDIREPVSENSIAVLVRTNKQARIMQEALREACVYAIVHSKQSIFKSREAGDVLRVMEAAAEPASAMRVRSALITSLLGVTAEELDLLNRDGAAMGARHERFLRLNAEWKSRGFIEMITRMMEEEEMLSRVLALPDGERRAANLLQLAELLQKAESEERLQPAALVKWLESRIAGGEEEAEEYVENLSTDEKAVSIITVHGSKGLEYGIVFCPFLWEVQSERPGAKDTPVIFHETTTREGGMHQLVFDIGSEEQESHRVIADEEQLAELTRLAYVALTRAECRCCVLYGHFSSAAESAAAYLLHPVRQGRPMSEFLADGTAVMHELERLAKEADGRILPVAMPDPEYIEFRKRGAVDGAREELVPRRRARMIEAAGGISSFTSLASHEGRVFTYVDEIRDEAATPQAPNLRTFVRGRLAGDFFHDVFENVEFDLSNAEELVASAIRKYGLDERDASAALGAVRSVLTKPLRAISPEFSLSDLERSHRQQEMEFYFPVSPFTRRQLRQFLNAYAGNGTQGRNRREELSDLQLKGWLTGKIDMVFMAKGKYYILDWKSNYLGPDREDYAPERLRRAMIGSDYVLQSLIYTVAADRYLRDRIPGYAYERDFGGVFYLYIRGIDASAQDDHGIFFEKPDRDSIVRLSELIAQPMPPSSHRQKNLQNEKRQKEKRQNKREGSGDE